MSTITYDTYGNGINDCALRSITMLEENNLFYLDATYDIETESQKFMVHIPRICVPIRKDYVSIRCETDFDSIYDATRINLGFGELNVRKDEDGHFYTVTVTEEKVHEMTLDEIEKKLGYKVKIVNKKE